MEAILEFFVNNYVWFLTISLILIFGLIGYIVDAHEKKSPKLHFQKEEDVNMNISEDQKSLKEIIEEDEEIEEAQLPVENEIESETNEEIIAPVESLDNNNELPNE